MSGPNATKLKFWRWYNILINIILKANVKYFCNVWILDESFYRFFLLSGKTENVVCVPSRCAICWNPFKFADVLSEKYLGEAKIKSITNGKSWQPLPIKFEQFVNWTKREKREKKTKEGRLTEKDWLGLSRSHSSLRPIQVNRRQ